MRPVTVAKSVAFAVALAVVGGFVGEFAVAKTAIGVITSVRAPTANRVGQVTIGKITFRIAKGAKLPPEIKKGTKVKVTYTGSGKVRDLKVNKKKVAVIQNLSTGLPGQGNDAGDCPDCPGSGGGDGGGGGGGGGT